MRTEGFSDFQATFTAPSGLAWGQMVQKAVLKFGTHVDTIFWSMRDAVCCAHTTPWCFLKLLSVMYREAGRGISEQSLALLNSCPGPTSQLQVRQSLNIFLFNIFAIWYTIYQWKTKTVYSFSLNFLCRDESALLLLLFFWTRITRAFKICYFSMSILIYAMIFFTSTCRIYNVSPLKCVWRASKY